MGERFGVFHEREPGDGSDHLARQVVLRRPQPAGADDEIRALCREGEHGDVVGHVVGNGGVERDRDADLRQPAAQPLAVGVEVLPAGQFGTNRDDFDFHVRSRLVKERVGYNYTVRACRIRTRDFVREYQRHSARRPP